MSVYRNVLAVVDLGETSATVLQHAAPLAELCDASLTVMHVVDYSPATDVDYLLPPQDELVVELISVAEKQHEKRYLDLAKNIQAGTVFQKAEPTTWRCMNCGYVHEGKSAPNLCPACLHEQAHFEVLGENW